MWSTCLLKVRGRANKFPDIYTDKTFSEKLSTPAVNRHFKQQKSSVSLSPVSLTLNHNVVFAWLWKPSLSFSPERMDLGKHVLYENFILYIISSRISSSYPTCYWRSDLFRCCHNYLLSHVAVTMIGCVKVIQKRKHSF